MMCFLFGWLACLTLFVIWRLHPSETTVITGKPEKLNIPTWPTEKLNVEFIETDRVHEILKGNPKAKIDDLLA